MTAASLYLERDAQQCANERGLNLVHDDDRYLLLDLDTAEQQERYRKGSLEPQYRRYIDDELWTTSVNGHAHVYVRLNGALDVRERIDLETELGSDPIRARLDRQRIDYNLLVESNVLFETDDEYKRVQEFLAN